MATALITVGPQTQVYAGLTRLTLSGQDSYLTTAVPADCALTAATMLWAFGDGTFGSGFCLSHVWASPGLITVTLLVTFEDGSTALKTQDVLVLPTPSFSEFKKYVSDSTGSDSNNGNSTGAPYKTIQKAIDTWNSFRGTDGSIPVNPGAIFLNKGDTFAYAGLDPISFGPIYVGMYGTGAAPIIAVATGKTWDLGTTIRDDRIENWVISDGPVPQWSAENVDNGVGMAHKGSQLSNCAVTNAGIYLHGAGSSIKTVTQTKGWRFGVFVSESTLSIEDSTFTANGHSAGFEDGTPADHQLYFASGTYIGVNRVTADATGAVKQLDAFKTSQVHKVYFGDCVAAVSRTAFDTGGNLGERCADIVYDRPVMTNCEFQGIWPAIADRISVRNLRSTSGMSACVLELQNFEGGIAGFEVFGASFSLFTGLFLRITDVTGSGFLIRDCAVVKANAGVFYDIPSLTALADLDTDYNCYWRTGGTNDTDANFAIVGGATKTFAQWQALGKDTHSKFRNPNFVSSSDLKLTAGSPAIDMGQTRGELLTDVTGVYRPIGAGYDAGAYELGSTGSPYSMTAEPGSYTIADISVGPVPNTRFGITTPAAAGAYTLVGQQALISDTSEGGSTGNTTMVAEPGAYRITRQNANLHYSNDPVENDNHTPITTVTRGPITFIPYRTKNGKIRWRLK